MDNQVITPPPKVYDCFCYFNEDLLLELRLETLWDEVDYFVICESVLTISGLPKPLYFDLENFQKYNSKIRHLVIRDYPFDTSDAWRNERWQRDYLINGLFDANPDDWILLSDVDEIDSTYKYYGYVDRDGGWYIMRKEVGTGTATIRYYAGTTSYALSWIGKASLGYDYWFNIF